MRVKSHWFRDEAGKSATDVASAAAFIVWRVAQNSLANMRKAGYELEPGPGYFAFLAEFIAFLVACADRIAYAKRDADWRLAFTTAVANRVGETLAGNMADLIGADPAAAKRRFIELVNGRAGDYAVHEWKADGPTYGFLRAFGHTVAPTLAVDRDRRDSVAQVIEVEAPEAVETLQKAMAGLFGEAPRRTRRAAGATGE